MPLTPPPPPPPHRPSSGGSCTGCRTSLGAGKTAKCPAPSLAITPPPSSRVGSAHQGPLPSSLPDASRLREILVDITEETNNGHGLRRHATIGARPVAPRVFASLGPVTRSRSLVVLPTPSRSRTHTPLIGGADENLPGTDSPAARLVLSRATQTPTTGSQPQPFYTPSPLGHRPRTVTRIEPLRIFPQPWSQPDSQSPSLPSSSPPTPSSSDISSEPRLGSRRRRRSVEPEDDSSPPLSTIAPPAALQPEPQVRRLRRFRDASAATATSTTVAQADPKRRKRNSTSSAGLGRL